MNVDNMGRQEEAQIGRRLLSVLLDLLGYFPAVNARVDKAE